MRKTLAVALIVAAALNVAGAWAEDDVLTSVAGDVCKQFVEASQPKSGTVAAVDVETMPPIIYVTLGSGDGILEGALLTVVAKGDPIKVGDEVVGFREKLVGDAEVARIQNEKLCVAAMRVPGKAGTTTPQPAEGNLAYLKTIPGTLVLSGFLRPDGKPCAMGDELADKLGQALQAAGRFKITERLRLEAVLREQKMVLSDLSDPTKAPAIGKLVVAGAVVMGTVTQQNDRYTITVRVVDIETGVIVATANATCGRSTELDGKYGPGKPPTGPGGGTGTITERPKVEETGTVTPFDQVKPFRANGYGVERQQHTSIAERLWDDAVSLTVSGMMGGGMGSQSGAQYDLGGGYDLFECWLGVDDGQTGGGMMGPGTMGPGMMGGGDQRAELVLRGDNGQTVRFTAERGDEARFISYPLTGVRSLVVSFTGYPILCNARFVKGRTTPSEPTDIYVGDGDVQYIQLPGEYRFHMGPRP